MQKSRSNALESTKAFRWIGRAIRVGRVATFTGVVACGVLFGWIGVVRGAAEQRAVHLGHELATLMDVVGGAHTVKINGETVYIASAVTEESPKAVLDRFEAHCLEKTGGLKEQFDAFPPEARAKLEKEMPEAWALRMGVLRDEKPDGTEGTVMCITQDGGGGVDGLLKRLAAFEASGELGELGNFRHAYVRKTETRGSHVLTSFTQGHFDVRKLFSEDEASESPVGVDPPNTPRPPNSFRLLSATIDDEPYGVQIFKTTEDMDAIGEFYERELPKREWIRMAGHLDVGGQIWQRNGVTMIVSMFPGQFGSRGTVTFAEGRTIQANDISPRY
ncbi:hypothetical protein AKJ09_00742 [Labilithrix luteola]|uniref:Uncharacterized protein n=1 Tax=Labilithrix luteola TaxID=1391654 RepID=A0A0K1PKL4_9BACT|nr:hypothetical protein [Labilithrix luteola]AKU94078.1 hypothetical protein AKJ09_00742 [Labilithrix luteola]